MRDVTLASSEWQQIVRGIKHGPRLVVVNFAGDDYDVGGRMDDARAAFAASGVQALVIADPLQGPRRGGRRSFPRKCGACINAFIEIGTHQAPCN